MSESVQTSMPFGQKRTIRAGSEENFSVDLPVGDLSSLSSTARRWKMRVRVNTSDRREFVLESKIKVKIEDPVI